MRRRVLLALVVVYHCRCCGARIVPKTFGMLSHALYSAELLSRACAREHNKTGLDHFVDRVCRSDGALDDVAVEHWLEPHQHERVVPSSN